MVACKVECERLSDLFTIKCNCCVCGVRRRRAAVARRNAEHAAEKAAFKKKAESEPKDKRPSSA